MTVIFATSNRTQNADFCSELPWTVYNAQDDPVRTARLALVKGKGAVVFCPADWNPFQMMQSAHQILREWPDTEVVLISIQLEAVTIQAVRANLARKLNSHSEASEISHALLDVLARAGALPAEDDPQVGQSRSFRRIKELIRKIAPFDMTVLITGETGTGKELAARAIHRLSARRDGPFVSVNCAAIPEGLLESELFGYDKGAFTGASAKQPGKLRSAHGGTIFFDEIGDMSLGAQAKILRALESREVQPLGGNASVPVDVRVVAATHQDLKSLVREQRFRADLYFRLSVLPVTIPPLRERPEDIPLLANRFIHELNARYGREIEGIDGEGMQALFMQDWPGNIRQLRNVVEGAFLVCESKWITLEDLEWFHGKPAQPQHADVHPMPRQNAPGFSYLPDPPGPDRLLEALQATRWNKSQAAKLLHWSRMTLYRRMAKYNLSQENPEPEVARAAFSTHA
jgi:transcriptional regulator with PAS, ATPase and Fis domain